MSEVAGTVDPIYQASAVRRLDTVGMRFPKL